MGITETLLLKNGIAKAIRERDADRIAKLEQENIELKATILHQQARLNEQDDALIDLAMWIEEVQNG